MKPFKQEVMVKKTINITPKYNVWDILIFNPDHEEAFYIWKIIFMIISEWKCKIKINLAWEPESFYDTDKRLSLYK